MRLKYDLHFGILVSWFTLDNNAVSSILDYEKIFHYYIIKWNKKEFYLYNSNCITHDNDINRYNIVYLSLASLKMKCLMIKHQLRLVIRITAMD